MRFDIVVEASVAKFDQNPTIREFLLKTGSRVLVEASPRDRILRTFRHSPRTVGVLAGTNLTQVTPNHPIYDAHSCRFLQAAAVSSNTVLIHLDDRCVRAHPASHFEPNAGNEEVFNPQIVAAVASKGPR